MKQTDSIVIVGYVYELVSALEIAVVAMLKEENRRIIPARDVLDYQDQLLEQIRFINLHHPHEPQIEAAFHNPGVPCLDDDQALRFKVGETNKMLISFTIYSSISN